MTTRKYPMHRFLFVILSLLVFLSGVSGQDNQNYVKTTERHTNGNTLVTYGYYDEGGRPCGTAEVGVTPDFGNRQLISDILTFTC